MEWLESRAVRPRQARYQAALRPDIKCIIDSKAISNTTATPIRRFESLWCKTVGIDPFAEATLWIAFFHSGRVMAVRGTLRVQQRPNWAISFA